MGAPWRASLLKSLDKNQKLPYAKYMQLATIGLDGKPANRTVVFRGFLEGSDNPMLVTDIRAKKVGEIQKNPLGEICWYFPETREQYRLSGLLTVTTHETTDEHLQQARRKAWQTGSNGMRQQFTWPPSAAPRTEVDEDFKAPAPSADSPLDTFCLVSMEVDAVDRLLLFENQRFRFMKSAPVEGTAHWLEAEVNP